MGAGKQKGDEGSYVVQIKYQNVTRLDMNILNLLTEGPLSLSSYFWFHHYRS